MAETILIVDDQASNARLTIPIIPMTMSPSWGLNFQGSVLTPSPKGRVKSENSMQKGHITIFAKIISGGQTGVDQGALEAALALNHPCGGWCPKGRLSEAGIIPAVFPVREHPSPDYRDRTTANVRDSDGTLIFSFGEPSGGTAYTLEQVEALGRPFCLIDLQDAVPDVISMDDGVLVFRQAPKERPAQPDVQAIRSWGCRQAVSVLNVAGPRESNHPGIQQVVKAVMLRVLGRE